MTKLNGSYYMFDCLNGSIQEKLFMASCFVSDKMAIQFACNLEATLIKIQYNNGKIECEEVIYDPYNLFNSGGQTK